MTFLCLYISEISLKTNTYSAFQTNSGFCRSYLESQTVISHQWLLKCQQEYHLFMEILDNGQELYFQQLNADSATQAAFDRAMELSRDVYGLDVTERGNARVSTYYDFRFSLDGQSYFGGTAVLPKENGFISVIFLYPLDLMNTQLRTQRTYALLAGLMGLLALLIFSWFFTGHMLRPMEENRRQQTQFIAAASHELRSPLTTMLSCLSAMKKADPEEAGHFMDTIEEEGARMSRLIQDMLSLANADNHSWTICCAPTELDTLLLKVYESFQPVTRAKHLHLDIELPDELLAPIPADASRITQVLSILLDNACTYVQEDGTILLRLFCRNSGPVIQVIDNGPGIPDSEKKAVFQRFYRSDTSRHSRDHFGLGLCIAQEIMTLHGGSLTLTDTPGGGSTFTLAFPIS